MTLLLIHACIVQCFLVMAVSTYRVIWHVVVTSLGAQTHIPTSQTKETMLTCFVSIRIEDHFFLVGRRYPQKFLTCQYLIHIRTNRFVQEVYEYLPLSYPALKQKLALPPQKLHRSKAHMHCESHYFVPICSSVNDSATSCNGCVVDQHT